MARITVDDCKEQMVKLGVEPNHFHLVVHAANRARALSLGSVEAQVPWENDKPTVVALREVATGYNIFEKQDKSSS